MGLAAADTALVDEVVRRSRPLLLACGLRPEEVAIHVEHDGPRLILMIRGGPSSSPLQHALAVRVLEAVAAGGVTRGDVQVAFDHCRPTAHSA